MASIIESHGPSATRDSLHVEDLSSLKSPEVGISVLEDHGDPEPQELLAPVTPEAGALVAEEVSEW